MIITRYNVPATTVKLIPSEFMPFDAAHAMVDTTGFTVDKLKSPVVPYVIRYPMQL